LEPIWISLEENAMATLTIKNIPEPLVKRLKQQAAAQHRSLNFQVISYLEQMTQSMPVDADILLARARAIRQVPRGTTLTDRLLNELKAVGRP
jgi:plasmid stability protein